MSLASAVVLLQTALSLLTLVNANPALPQAMRDHATAVAEQAISEAHAALATKGASVEAAAPNPPSTQPVALAPSATKAGPVYAYPNPALTSGAVLTTDASTICTPGYASSVRNVSAVTKKQVYAEYGVSATRSRRAPMRSIISSRLKSAARTTSRTCGWKPRLPHPASIRKTSLKTSNTIRCARVR